MRTRTKGIRLDSTGERIVDKQYRGQRIFERLGKVSQDDAEAWLRQRQAKLDLQRDDELRNGHEELFRVGAAKYLLELHAAGDVRSLETISGHVLLLNQWVGDTPLGALYNDSFTDFKADRLAGRARDGRQVRAVKASTVNRSLEVARTVLNRAARVWRTNGRPWLSAAPLIEMLDEKATARPPYPITWAEQARLLPLLPPHLQAMALFDLNTGARDENVVGLRWEWEVPVPEVGRSVFVIPLEEFKGKRYQVLVLNDVAWSIVEAQRGKHAEYVFVYRRERSAATQEKYQRLGKAKPAPYKRVETMNNTAWQNARAKAKVPARVHDLRHTFAQRLRDAGVSEEDRALLIGHAVEGMAQHYATSTIARLIGLANSVQETRDQTTVLRLVTMAQMESHAKTHAEGDAQRKTG